MPAKKTATKKPTAKKNSETMKWGKLEFDFEPLTAWYTIQVSSEEATFKTAFDEFLKHVEEHDLYRGEETLTLELLAKQGSFRAFDAWMGEWHDRGNAELLGDTAN